MCKDDRVREPTCSKRINYNCWRPGLQDTARHSSENFLLRDDKGSFSDLCTGKDMHNWKIQELL